jgi:type I restriction-modification system DNA methylase subunit
VGQKPEASFIWSIANLLRGPYKPNEYGDVVLPMTILRRLGTDEQRPARGQAA